ncbi:MAG: hypothetical protein ACP5FH_06010 [Terracidiphilus sp.]
MVDYAKLAVDAQLIQQADCSAGDTRQKLRAYWRSILERVRAQVAGEMKKANVELRKRGVATIDRCHLPGFEDEIFLTYGTDTLCRVGVGERKGEFHITAVISGPPNGYEIARKEYGSRRENSYIGIHLAEAEEPAVDPESLSREIAIDVISSIIFGRFD